MAKKPKTIEHLDASIARWKTRLKRAVNMIDKLEKQRKRMTLLPKPRAKLAATVKPEPLAVTILKEMAAPVPAPVKAAEIDDDIPAFLRRQSSPSPEAEQIRAEQAATKKKKAAGRIAKMKAKQSGETKRMPLTGRAALEAIRNG